MKKKLTSRKFWVAVSGIVAGILMMFGYADTSVDVVAGAIVTVGSTVGYMIAEGKADAANIGKAIEETVDAVDVIKKETKKVDKKA